jgi:hypothetical protein
MDDEVTQMRANSLDAIEGSFFLSHSNGGSLRSGIWLAKDAAGIRPSSRFRGRPLMDQDRRKDWREICKAAASELDPAKLMSLVSELTRALDERDKKKRDATSEALDALKDERLETKSLRGEPAVG